MANAHLHPVFQLALATFAPPLMHPFVVQVRCGPTTLMEFGAMGVDKEAVERQHADLCELGQYLRVFPAGQKEEPFPVAVARNAVECVEMRQAIPEAEAIAADLARNVNKASRLAEANDACARVVDMQHLDAMRKAGL